MKKLIKIEELPAIEKEMKRMPVGHIITVINSHSRDGFSENHSEYEKVSDSHIRLNRRYDFS